jgi:2-methylcitrate dehydratase PrpD
MQPPPRPFTMPPESRYAITECYFKPYACCRHLQPAAEALFTILNESDIAAEQIQAINVETYTLASEHAHVPWSDFASSQLSFPFIMALAAQFRQIDLEHFSDATRADPRIAALAGKVTVEATAAMDARYPKQRPALVRVVAAKGEFSRDVPEALGDPSLPISDKQLGEKFVDLASPALGRDPASALLKRFWQLEQESDVAPLLNELAGKA